MNKWDIRYLDVAENISTWSKDPSKKIGAVAVSKKGQILATGYNGLPRGIDDSDERLNNRDLKYQLVVHAEMNLIYNATYIGTSLNKSTIYVTGLPVCSDCVKGLIQVGVARIVMRIPKDVPDKWSNSWELTKSLLLEANIAFDIATNL